MKIRIPIPRIRLSDWASLLVLAVNLAFVVPAAIAPATAAEPPKPVLIFAAASLTNAVDEIAAAYAANGHEPLRTSYASSSVLANQIKAGAPADIFISADQEWMDVVEKAGLIRAGSRIDLLGNRLVLIARRDDSIAIKIAPGLDLVSLLDGGRLAVGDPDSVPAGIYAKAALAKLGIWPNISDHLARAENVRSALLYVARGECRLGIVYATDAQIEPKVRVAAEFAPDLYPPIVYPAALIGSSPSAADAFKFLASDAAARIFERYGFQILSTVEKSH